MTRCFNTHSKLMRFLGALLLLVGFATTAQAQWQRNLPLNSLRGTLTFNAPPQVTLNGQAMQLTPACRIHGANNMLVLSGVLAGQQFTVNYVLDFQGLLREVWILTQAEASALWPQTTAQAAAWTWDPVQKVWSKP